MKLHVISDTHFEHMSSIGAPSFFTQLEAVQVRDPANTLVLAGDICTIYHANKWKSSLAQLCSMYRHVLYVPGNHEYYGISFDDGADFFAQIEKAPEFHNLVNLDRLNGVFEIDGQRFFGGTMWFADKDYDRNQKRCMSDFYVINDFEPEVYNLNKHFIKRYNQFVQAGDIIVTHHTPLAESIHPQYAGSFINDFFMSDRTNELCEENLPKLWIHGHTHNAFDYQYVVGQKAMRVYCNPHGYPNEGENVRFFDKVVVDV